MLSNDEKRLHARQMSHWCSAFGVGYELVIIQNSTTTIHEPIFIKSDIQAIEMTHSNVKLFVYNIQDTLTD